MTKEEILNNLWEPTGQDFLTFRDDLETAIEKDPSLEKIERAMDYYADQELALLTEKYNKLKEAFDKLLSDRIKAGNRELGTYFNKTGCTEFWYEEAGLKEQ